MADRRWPDVAVKTGVDDGGKASQAPDSPSSRQSLSLVEVRWLDETGIDATLDRMLRDIRAFTRGGSLRAAGRGTGYGCELTIPRAEPTARLARIRDLTLAACRHLDKAVERSRKAHGAAAERYVLEAHEPAARARALLDAARAR